MGQTITHTYLTEDTFIIFIYNLKKNVFNQFIKPMTLFHM